MDDELGDRFPWDDAEQSGLRFVAYSVQTVSLAVTVAVLNRSRKCWSLTIWCCACVVTLGAPGLGLSATVFVARNRCLRRTILLWLQLKLLATFLVDIPARNIPNAWLRSSALMSITWQKQSKHFENLITIDCTCKTPVFEPVCLARRWKLTCYWLASL
jgi:hypothetical protein